MVDCLVCGAPTASTHMGIDVCRACTVFYKRNCETGAKLQCIRNDKNCMKNGKKKKGRTCRRCRLDRFEEVVKESGGEGENVTASLAATGTESDHEINAVDQSLRNSLNTEISIIEKIRDNHRVLSEFRCGEELKLRGMSSTPTHANDEKYEIFPATFQFTNEGAKILANGLFDFVSFTFPEFRSLPKSDQWMLISNYHRCFRCIDSRLRARRRFGKDEFVYFSTYTSFITADTLTNFFDDCPDTTNARVAAKRWLETYAEVMPKLRSLVDKFDPSDDELLAMIALAFWCFGTFDPSDQMLDLATTYRAMIVAEMTVIYRQTRTEENATGRVGQLLCLVEEFKRVEMSLTPEYEICRMLNVFDDDTLIYKLQSCSLSSSEQLSPDGDKP